MLSNGNFTSPTVNNSQCASQDNIPSQDIIDVGNGREVRDINDNNNNN